MDVRYKRGQEGLKSLNEENVKNEEELSEEVLDENLEKYNINEKKTLNMWNFKSFGASLTNSLIKA